MMITPVEKIQAVREQKSKLLSEYEQQSARLLASIQQLKAQISGLDLAIEAAMPKGEESLAPPLPGAGKYEAMAMTPAVLDVVQMFGEPPGLLVPEIIERLKAEGFQSPARNLYASIYSIAMRLVEQEKIYALEKNSKRSFARKEPF